MDSIIPALRVAQLDITELDNAVMNLLSSQLQLCFKYKSTRFDLLTIEPHLRTALYGILLYNTLWKNNQTIGQKLLGLRYGDSKTLASASGRKLLFLQTALLLMYWYKSSKQTSTFIPSKPRYIRLVTKFLNTAISLLSIGNFLIFLHQGFFHSLLLRLAGLRTVYVDPNPPERNITFETMAREILWHGFAETGVFILSLINIAKLRRQFANFFYVPTITETEPILDSCAFCENLPVLPHQGNCKLHVFCYYCVAAVLIADPDAKCPSCQKRLESISPLETSRSLITT